MPAFELLKDIAENAVIKVIGVGGGGGNAVSHMFEAGLPHVEFIAANTDAQALRNAKANTLLQLGANLTRGLGAGASPEIGRQAALEDRDQIAKILEGADMLFIAAGMGGGTGTGAAPVVAEIAREMGILTVAVVSRPFGFEGRKRELAAAQGLEDLSENVDSLITIPNERLLTVLGKGASLPDCFKAANNVLLGAVQGISEVITNPGLINVDFADVRAVMGQRGRAMMGTGRGRGENRAREATQEAIASPLLDNINLAGAKGLLVNVSSGHDMTIGEFNEIGELVREFASEDATVIIGTALNEELGEEIRVTVVATGIGQPVENATPIVGQRARRSIASVLSAEESAPAATTHIGSRTKSDQDRLFGEILDIPAFLRRQAD